MYRKALCIIAAIICLAGCTNSDPVRDALLERAGTLPSVETVSCEPAGSSLWVSWNPEKALKEGAVSFTIQVSTDQYFFSGEGSSLVTKTIQASDSPNDITQVYSLVKGQEYYVRISAVYIGPSTSEWTYYSDAAGNPISVVI